MRHSNGTLAADAPALREIPPCIERLKSLRCLVAVVRHGSTLRASEAVHLSQPAVTRSILELERAFAMPLFERGGRGMAPTQPGVAAAKRAAQLVDHLAQGAAEAIALSPLKGRRAPSPERYAAAVGSSSLAAMLAVATAGSESRAAQLLGVRQPSIHRSLLVLEQLCGAMLLQKSTRGTRLTEGGEAMLLRIKLAFAEARALEAELASWRGQIRGRVTVGALPLAAIPLLVRAIDEVSHTHPEVEVTVVDGTYESLMQQLRSADVDLVVGALRPAPPPGVVQEVLYDEDLVVVCRRNHPCLQVTRLGLSDLHRWRWVLPLPGTPARAALQRAFASAGLDLPRETLQATSALFTRSFVARTDCLTLATRSQAVEEREGEQFDIAPVRLAGSERPIGITTRSIGEPSPDLRAVLEALRNTAAARQPASAPPTS